MLFATKWRKVELPKLNRSRDREDNENSVFWPSARPRTHFSKSEKNLIFARLRATKCRIPQLSTVPGSRVIGVGIFGDTYKKKYSHLRKK